MFEKIKEKLKLWYKKSVRREIEDDLSKQIEEDDPRAWYLMYLMKNNSVVEKTDEQSVFLWCQKAAEAGLAPAQYDLALYYYYGDFVAKDIYTALLWMEKAANQNYTEACRKLYSIYMANTRIKRNEERALYWQERSLGAELEDIGSIIKLEPWMIAEPEETVKKPESAIEEEKTESGKFELITQENVITADVNQSFIINAGPGTGKTYTLIERINYLVSMGCTPEDIVVLSFTNAVVQEVKLRLYAKSNNGGDRSLRNVFVRTYHSLSWWLLRMANENMEEDEWKSVSLDFNTLSYEDGLIKAAELIENNPDIVSGWQHLIVDEIQDINNGKARFVIALVKACVEYHCPVLLLGDSCQAIYNYLNQEKNAANVNITAEEFFSRIQNIMKDTAKFVSFDINHRQSTKLQELTQPLREVILTEQNSEYVNKVGDFCSELRTINLDDVSEFIKENPLTSICLMERSNIETKMLSNALNKHGIDHICVLNQNKSAFPAWIGKAFSGFDDSYLSKDAFRNSLERLELGLSEDDFDVLWEKLKSGSDTFTDIVDFRVLERHFKNHDFDTLIQTKEARQNVFVSNIHRAKGLEFDMVILDNKFALTKKKTDEMKVFYVAVTRPRKEMILMDTNIKWKYTKVSKYGRMIQYKKVDDVWLYDYIVIDNSENDSYPDISPLNYIFENEAEMDKSQKIIQGIEINDEIELLYDASADNYSINLVRDNSSVMIGWMSPRFLKSIRRKKYVNLLPNKLNELYVEGVYTHIGSSDGYKDMSDYLIDKCGHRYSKNKIWNYVLFSGPAKAVYK